MGKAGAAPSAQPQVRNLNAEAQVAAAGALKKLKKLAKSGPEKIIAASAEIQVTLAGASYSKMYQHGAPVRKQCALTLSKLSAECLLADGHCETLLALYEDSDEGVRQAALQVLTTRVKPGMLVARCAQPLLALLENNLAATREAVVRTLVLAEPWDLVAHVLEACVRLLEHPACGVRESTLLVLARVDAASLAMHSDSILAKLEDPYGDVREAAKLAVARLVVDKPAVVSPHADKMLSGLKAESPEERADAERAVLTHNKGLLAMLATMHTPAEVNGSQPFKNRASHDEISAA